MSVTHKLGTYLNAKFLQEMVSKIFSLGVFTIGNRPLSSAQWLHERDICGSSYESTHNFHLEMFKPYDSELPLFSHKNPQLNSI